MSNKIIYLCDGSRPCYGTAVCKLANYGGTCEHTADRSSSRNYQDKEPTATDLHYSAFFYSKKYGLYIESAIITNLLFDGIDQKPEA